MAAWSQGRKLSREEREELRRRVSDARRQRVAEEPVDELAEGRQEEPGEPTFRERVWELATRAGIVRRDGTPAWADLARLAQVEYRTLYNALLDGRRPAGLLAGLADALGVEASSLGAVEPSRVPARASEPMWSSPRSGFGHLLSSPRRARSRPGRVVFAPPRSF